MTYINRYSPLISDGLTKQMPFIKLSPKSTDKSKIWNKSIDRMDNISYKYYGHPYGGWLIMLANPQYSDEFEIPDGTLIVIPFPYLNSIQQFSDALNLYDSQFGL